MLNPSDAELVRRCAAREPQAWTLLVDRYGRLVIWALRRQLGRLGRGPEEAEDLFQAVWSRLWRGEQFKKIRDPRCLSAWLVSVAVNEARAYVRARTRGGKITELSLEASGVLESKAAGKERSPYEAASSRELGEVLKREFDSLPARDRMILRLFFEEGTKARVIAGFLQMPVNTVLSIISRAREKVKGALRAKGIEP